MKSHLARAQQGGILVPLQKLQALEGLLATGRRHHTSLFLTFLPQPVMATASTLLAPV